MTRLALLAGMLGIGACQSVPDNTAASPGSRPSTTTERGPTWSAPQPTANGASARPPAPPPVARAVRGEAPASAVIEKEDGPPVAEAVPPTPSKAQASSTRRAPAAAPSARRRGSDQSRNLYNKSSEAYALLQKPDRALAHFPLDRLGAVDWVATLRQGLIEPRANVAGTAQMKVLDLDVVMKNTREMDYVLFPHRAHTEWLACSNCHDGIFKPKAGANPIDMSAIFRGHYCGVCHDRVAFSVFACERCHSVPHPDAAQR